MTNLFSFMQLRQYSSEDVTGEDVSYNARELLDFSRDRAPRIAELIEGRQNLAALAAAVLLWKAMKPLQKAIVLGTAGLCVIGRQVVSQEQPDELQRLRDGLYARMSSSDVEKLLADKHFKGFIAVMATLQAGAMQYGRSLPATDSFLRGVGMLRLANGTAPGADRVAPLLTTALALPVLDTTGIFNTTELRQLLDDVERVDARVRLGSDDTVGSVQMEIFSTAQWKGKFDGALTRLNNFREEVGLDVKQTLAHLKSVIQTEMDLAARRGERNAANAFKDIFSLGPEEIDQLDYASKARVRILGRGDLMQVRTKTIGYKLGDIAHVENISAKSHRGRKTVLESETTTTTLKESFEESLSETTTSETETMDMSRLASKAASNTVSGSVYGEAGASYGGAFVLAGGSYTNTSTTEGSNSSAVSFGKEVASETVSMARTEIFSRETATVRNKSVDTVEQSFTNESGEHVRGIYRWLEKVEEAQVYNYGERLLLELIVPEPATQLLQISTPEAGGAPVPPEDITFTADYIDEDNYLDLAKQFGVSSTETPPAFERFVSEVIVTDPAVPQAMAAEDAESIVLWAYGVKGKTLEIPEGYMAVSAYISVAFPFRDPDGGMQDIDISLGTNRVNISEQDTAQNRIVEISPHLEGPVPLGIGIDHKYGAAASFRILCRRSETARRIWQQKVYDQIMFEYDQKMETYRAALARHQAIADAFEIPATNAAMNRTKEQRELKRACQTLMSRQYFYSFGALDFESGAVSEIQGDKIWQDSQFIQFFEDCFEWHLMSYVFYPYQWAGRHRWQSLLARKSDDPLYQSFLQAGAARVVVSVREGYEHIVAKYLTTGVIPELNLIPWRDSDVTYPPVAELIADANDRPAGEVAIGDPWEFTTPTPYLYLQTSADVNDSKL